MFWQKKTRIEQLFHEYLDESSRCLQSFQEAIGIFFETGLGPQFKAKVDEVRQGEWAADQKRRSAEQEMFRQALMPALRGDLLGLLEALDEVPNQCEETVGDLWLQDVMIPAEYAEKVRELVGVNVEANDRLMEAVRQLFDDPAGVTGAADRVIQKEKEADAIEQELVKAIFDSDRELAEKILLKHIVNGIAEIADVAEDASDRVRIVAVKQKS